MANEKTFMFPIEGFSGKLVKASKTAQSKYMLGTKYILKPISISQENGSVIFEVCLSGPKLVLLMAATKLCNIQFNFYKDNDGVSCIAKPTDWVISTWEMMGTKHTNRLIEQVYNNLM